MNVCRITGLAVLLFPLAYLLCLAVTWMEITRLLFDDFVTMCSGIYSTPRGCGDTMIFPGSEISWIYRNVHR